jgi:biopolymer transport protein ExbD
MSRKRRTTPIVPEDAKLDMSPMIDMVFQLIIFFMVTANFVVMRKDPEVVVPVAPKGEIPKNAEGRVLVNIYSDAYVKEKGLKTAFSDEDSKTLTLEEITKLMEDTKRINDKRNMPTVLYLRGDHKSIVRRTKEVLKAAGAGGVNDVVFAAFQKPQAGHKKTK